MSKYSLVAGAALAVISTAVLAQEPPKIQEPPKAPSIDQQVEQSQMRFYAAQAEYHLALAKKFQAEAAAGAQREAATARWWGAWWESMYPAKTEPAAAAAPEKPTAK